MHAVELLNVYRVATICGSNGGRNLVIADSPNILKPRSHEWVFRFWDGSPRSAWRTSADYVNKIKLVMVYLDADRQGNTKTGRLLALQRPMKKTGVTNAGLSKEGVSEANEQSKIVRTHCSSGIATSYGSLSANGKKL